MEEGLFEVKWLLVAFLFGQASALMLFLAVRYLDGARRCPKCGCPR